jgi:hypothetical protein
MNLTTLLQYLQVVVGLAVAAGAFVTLMECIDEHSPVSVRWCGALLMVAGAWFGIEPLILGFATSTKPGLFMASCIAWGLIRFRGTILNLVVTGHHQDAKQ